MIACIAGALLASLLAACATVADAAASAAHRRRPQAFEIAGRLAVRDGQTQRHREASLDAHARRA